LLAQRRLRDDSRCTEPTRARARKSQPAQPSGERGEQDRLSTFEPWWRCQTASGRPRGFASRRRQNTSDGPKGRSPSTLPDCVWQPDERSSSTALLLHSLAERQCRPSASGQFIERIKRLGARPGRYASTSVSGRTGDGDDGGLPAVDGRDR